ncbi:MAG: hypothetical protein HY366_02960 [Candidatus Aenigmarchaeota archaeon]|nr:hypothetical protein [Candidatus Aenigmarchaeota archaeon]
MGEEGRRVGEVLETAAAYDAYRNKHLDHGTGTKTSDPVYEGPAAAAHGQPTQRHGGRT